MPFGGLVPFGERELITAILCLFWYCSRRIEYFTDRLAGIKMTKMEKNIILTEYLDPSKIQNVFFQNFILKSVSTESLKLGITI